VAHAGGTLSDAPAPSAALHPERGLSWVLLPATWCAWLLAWLTPVLLVAPRLETPRSWMTPETAPAALVMAAAFFLAALWPFWPALAGEVARPRRIGVRWLGLSILELAILLALAAPFALVAWSVGGAAIAWGPLAAAVAGLAVFCLGLRMAVGGLPAGAGRWLMLAAMLVCAGPPIVAYAAVETMSWTSRITGGCVTAMEASPPAAAMRLALGGWPADGWLIFARLILWPAVGVMLAIVGLLAARAHARAGSM
jgi:hypothetical protein